MFVLWPGSEFLKQFPLLAFSFPMTGGFAFSNHAHHSPFISTVFRNDGSERTT